MDIPSSKLLSYLAVIFLLFGLFFDIGYFAALGLGPQQVPLTLVDYARATANYLSLFIFMVLLTSIMGLAAGWNHSKSGSEEPVVSKVTRKVAMPKWVSWVVGISILCYLGTSCLRFDVLVFILGLAWQFHYYKGVSKAFGLSFAKQTGLQFGVYMLILSVALGYNWVDQTLNYHLDQRSMKITVHGEILDDAILMRHFDSGALIALKDEGVLRFVSRDPAVASFQRPLKLYNPYQEYYFSFYDCWEWLKKALRP